MTTELERLDFPETNYPPTTAPLTPLTPTIAGTTDNALVQAVNRLAAAIERLNIPQDKPAQGPLAPLPALSVNPVGPGVCPVHRVQWKLVPAGITKRGPRAGQPYKAFLACPQQGCDQRGPEVR